MQLAALLAVQVVQAFTHHPLDPGLTHAIFAGASMGVAALGAYLMPHQDRPSAPAVQSAQERADFEEWAAAGKPLIRFGNVTRVEPSASVQPSATGTGSAQ